MVIYYVQENSANGIEGSPDYYTNVLDAQKAFALKVWYGPEVGDSSGATSLKEVVDYLTWRADGFLSDGEEWSASVGEDEIAVWREWREENPDGMPDEFDDSDKYNEVGNQIFEAGVISIDNKQMIEMNNSAYDKLLYGEST